MRRAELSREELDSARKWGAAVRRHATRRAGELHRWNSKAKILAAILRELAAGAKVVDRRALAVIARAAGVQRRHVRRTIARLEADGELVRVLGRGVRLPGQRGHMTSAIVVPAIFPLLELLRPARAAFARARFDLLALRLELEALGVKIPLAPAPEARQAARLAAIGGAPVQAHPPIDPIALGPSGRALPDAVRNIGPLGPPSASVTSPQRGSSSSAVPPSDDRSPLPPSAARVWTSADGRAGLEEVTAPPLMLEASPASELGGLRTTASSSGAAAGDELEHRAAAPASGDRARGSRREGSRPTVPEHLRSGRASPSAIVAWLEGQGTPRAEAVQIAYRWRTTYGVRLGRDAKAAAGELELGRKPRARTVARELAAITDERKARDERAARRARGIFTDPKPPRKRP